MYVTFPSVSDNKVHFWVLLLNRVSSDPRTWVLLSPGLNWASVKAAHLWVQQVVVWHENNICLLFQGTWEVVRTDPGDEEQKLKLERKSITAKICSAPPAAQLEDDECAQQAPIRSMIMRRLDHSPSNSHSYLW